MTTTDNPAAARIAASQQAVRAAEAAFEQAVRDEVNSENLTPSDVARTLGTKNRQRVYAILGRGEDGGAPTPPTLPRIVYLRGAGCGDSIWTHVVDAMHARGWVTIRDRTQAWHLARGGMEVMFCDFSSTRAELHATTVTVGRVRARYADDGDMELPLISGGELARPEYFDTEVVNKLGQPGAVTLDVDKLARMVADEFAS